MSCEDLVLKGDWLARPVREKEVGKKQRRMEEEEDSKNIGKIGESRDKWVKQTKNGRDKAENKAE